MSRKRLLSVLRPLLGLSLLGYVLSQLPVDDLSRLWSTGDRRLLSLGFVGFLLSFGALQALRLHVLVRRYTGGLSGSLQLFAIGAFFNNFLPSNVGGDAVRLLYLQRMRPGHWAAPLALLLLHRLSGIALLWLATGAHIALHHRRLAGVLQAAGGLQLRVPSMWLWALPLAAALSIAVLLRTGPGRKLRGKLAGVWRNCRVGLSELTAVDLAALVITTLAYHLGRAAALHYTLAFLGFDIPTLDLLPVLSVVAVVMVLPVTIGGLGVFEGSVAGLLTLYGVPPTLGATAALVNRAALVVLAAVGGVVYVARRRDLHAAAQQLASGAAGNASAARSVAPESD